MSTADFFFFYLGLRVGSTIWETYACLSGYSYIWGLTLFLYYLLGLGSTFFSTEAGFSIFLYDIERLFMPWVF